jgi:hypothetical protein
MITTKEIIQSITSISTYFKTLLFLGFIWLVSKLFANLIDIPIQLIALPIFILIVIIGTYLATSPLFIDYREVIGKLSETARITLADLKKEQANGKMIIADLQGLERMHNDLQAKYNNLQANQKQNQLIISELQQENSELKASDNNELATVKQELSKAKGYLSQMQTELLAKTTKLNSLQQTEKFIFLVQLGLSKEQIKKGLVNTVNGLMNGKTEAEKENIKQIFNS